MMRAWLWCRLRFHRTEKGIGLLYPSSHKSCPKCDLEWTWM